MSEEGTTRVSSKQLVEFPPGEKLLEPIAFKEEVFSLVDDRLALGDCTEGRLELSTGESRLTCLFHRSKPYLAGLQDRHVFTPVPLYDFVARSRQLQGAICTLVKTDMPLVLMTAIHFCKQPILKGSTQLVDPSHVLEVLAGERQDAAIAFEREGKRTLLFLKDGVPARLYFGNPEDDSGEGSLEDRALAFAFDPRATPCTVEVFSDLRIVGDPDSGTSLMDLAESTRPAPPVDICLYYPDGSELRRRPYAGPEMIVGRDPKVDLFIDNLAVSRRHARITWERGSFVIEDLGSANGTVLDGTQITHARIDAASKVEIGKFALSIHEYPAEPQVLETMFIPIRPTPATGLLVGRAPAGNDCSERLEPGTDLIFGKGDGVDVPVRGFRVRAVHARLSCRDGKFHLGSFGGAKVRVNGSATRSVSLAFGDEIQIGRSRFRLVRQSAVGA